MSVFMQPIFTQTITSQTVSSIYFYNIPQGYQDLKVVVSARSTDSNIATGCGFNLYNGNTFVASSGTKLEGNGSSAYSQRYGTMNVPGATATANTFGNVEMIVPNYAGGSYKQAIMDSVTENNSGTAYQDITAMLVPSTAPVTTVGFNIFAGNFAAGSTFTLYGVAEQYSTQTPVAPTITSIVDQAGFASVNFLPTASDNATVYAVTDNNSNTTYGAGSPIVAPATLGSQTIYTAKAINTLGTTSAAGTAAITSANSYASIATSYVSASGGVSSITFSNIPQNYTHLQIRALTRSTIAQSGSIYTVIFNADSGSNYSYHQLNADGSSVYASSGNSLTGIQLRDTTGASNLTNNFGVALVDIIDYTNTNKYKVLKYMGGYDNNGSGFISLDSGAWLNYSPISSITISTYANFAQYSHFALYGIA
jgi:hypothetical protein